MTTTKVKLEFVHAMARNTKATVRQCETLMRFAATLQRLAEDDCNVPADDAGLARREAKRNRIQRKVTELCGDLAQARYDVVRNHCTVSANLEFIDAQSLRDSLLEQFPNDDCQIVNMGVVPLFQNDPRGAVLKIRVPSGYTNDFGGEGICVPS